METLLPFLEQLEPLLALLLLATFGSIIVLWKKLGDKDAAIAQLNEEMRSRDRETLDVLKDLTAALETLQRDGSASFSDVKAGIERILDRIQHHAESTAQHLHSYGRNS